MATHATRIPRAVSACLWSRGESRDYRSRALFTLDSGIYAHKLGVTLFSVIYGFRRNLRFFPLFALPAHCYAYQSVVTLFSVFYAFCRNSRYPPQLTPSGVTPPNRRNRDSAARPRRGNCSPP